MSHPYPQSTANPHRRFVALLPVTVAVAVAVAVVTSLALPVPAVAAEIGPGYQRPGQALDHLGGYRTADGTVAYCIDIGEPSTVGASTTDAGLVEQVNGLDPATMLRLNVVLSLHGATSDADTAAAVAMVVWSLADTEAYTAAGGDSGVLGRAPASARPSIQALADAFRSEAVAYVPRTAEISAELRIAEGDDYAGAVALTVAPPDATASVTLTNAVFSDTGLTTREDISNGQLLPIVAAPPATSTYRVSVAAETSSGGGPSSAVRLFSTPGAQTLIAASPPMPISASTTATDARDRRAATVVTVAQPTGVVGGTVVDTATVTGVPERGADLTWAGYLQPTGSRTPVCTDAERIFSSGPTRIAHDGNYPSRAFDIAPEHVGIVYWVATLTVAGAAPISDRCGAPEERSTLVAVPELPVVSG